MRDLAGLVWPDRVTVQVERPRRHRPDPQLRPGAERPDALNELGLAIHPHESRHPRIREHKVVNDDRYPCLPRLDVAMPPSGNRFDTADVQVTVEQLEADRYDGELGYHPGHDLAVAAQRPADQGRRAGRAAGDDLGVAVPDRGAAGRT